MRPTGLALAFVAAAMAPMTAWAEVVTLTCSRPNLSYTFSLMIDFDARTVCDLASVQRPPCVVHTATITEQYVAWEQNVVERATGVVHWASGDSGSCQRAQRVF